MLGLDPIDTEYEKNQRRRNEIRGLPEDWQWQGVLRMAPVWRLQRPEARLTERGPRQLVQAETTESPLSWADEEDRRALDAIREENARDEMALRRQYWHLVNAYKRRDSAAFAASLPSELRYPDLTTDDIDDYFRRKTLTLRKKGQENIEAYKPITTQIEKSFRAARDSKAYEEATQQEVAALRALTSQRARLEYMRNRPNVSLQQRATIARRVNNIMMEEAALRDKIGKRQAFKAKQDARLTAAASARARGDLVAANYLDAVYALHQQKRADPRLASAQSQAARAEYLRSADAYLNGEARDGYISSRAELAQRSVARRAEETLAPDIRFERGGVNISIGGQRRKRTDAEVHEDIMKEGSALYGGWATILKAAGYVEDARAIQNLNNERNVYYNAAMKDWLLRADELEARGQSAKAEELRDFAAAYIDRHVTPRDLQINEIAAHHHFLVVAPTSDRPETRAALEAAIRGAGTRPLSSLPAERISPEGITGMPSRAEIAKVEALRSKQPREGMEPPASEEPAPLATPVAGPSPARKKPRKSDPAQLRGEIEHISALLTKGKPAVARFGEPPPVVKRRALTPTERKQTEERLSQKLEAYFWATNPGMAKYRGKVPPEWAQLVSWSQALAGLPKHPETYERESARKALNAVSLFRDKMDKAIAAGQVGPETVKFIERYIPSRDQLKKWRQVIGKVPRAGIGTRTGAGLQREDVTGKAYADSLVLRAAHAMMTTGLMRGFTKLTTPSLLQDVEQYLGQPRTTLEKGARTVGSAISYIRQLMLVRGGLGSLAPKLPAPALGAATFGTVSGGGELLTQLVERKLDLNRVGKTTFWSGMTGLILGALPAPGSSAWGTAKTALAGGGGATLVDSLEEIVQRGLPKSAKEWAEFAKRRANTALAMTAFMLWPHLNPKNFRLRTRLRKATLRNLGLREDLLTNREFDKVRALLGEDVALLRSGGERLDIRELGGRLEGRKIVQAPKSQRQAQTELRNARIWAKGLGQWRHDIAPGQFEQEIREVPPKPMGPGESKPAAKAAPAGKKTKAELEEQARLANETYLRNEASFLPVPGAAAKFAGGLTTKRIAKGAYAIVDEKGQKAGSIAKEGSRFIVTQPPPGRGELVGQSFRTLKAIRQVLSVKPKPPIRATMATEKPSESANAYEAAAARSPVAEAKQELERIRSKPRIGEAGILQLPGIADFRAVGQKLRDGIRHFLRRDDDVTRDAAGSIAKWAAEATKAGLYADWARARLRAMGATPRDLEVADRWLDNPKKYQAVFDALPKPAQDVAHELEADYRALRELAQKHGVFDAWREAYTPHMYSDNPARLKRLLYPRGGQLGTGFRFGQPRKFETMDDAEAAGLHPIRDPIKKNAIYRYQLYRVLANRNLIETLKLLHREDGLPVIMGRPRKAEKLRVWENEYQWVNAPGLGRFMYVGEAGEKPMLVKIPAKAAPEVAKLLNDAFSPWAPRSTVERAYKRLRGRVKRLIMYNPLIHGWNILSDVFDEMNFNPYATVKVFKRGKELYEKQDAIVERGANAGLNLDVAYSVANEIREDLMGSSPEAARLFKPITKMEKWLDNALWRSIVRNGQIGLFEVLTRRIAKRHPDWTQERVDITAANHINRLLGTLPHIWFTRAGREASSFLLFARNWTLSNLDMVAIALSRGRVGMGLRSLSKAERTELANMYTKHLFKGIFGLMAMANFVQLGSIEITNRLKKKGILDGPQVPLHLTFANERRHWYDIDTGLRTKTGQRIYLVAPFFRYVRDYIGWSTEPARTLYNKLEPVFKNGMEVLFNYSRWQQKEISKRGAPTWDAIKQRGLYFVKGITPSAVFAGRPGKVRTTFEWAIPFSGTWIRRGAPGGEFTRLLWEFRSKEGYKRGKIDDEIDVLVQKGKFQDAVQLMLKTQRYTSADGVALRLLRLVAPLNYYWRTAGTRERLRFLKYLKERGKSQDALFRALRQERIEVGSRPN